VALHTGARALEILSAQEETPLLADVLRWQGSVLRDRGQTGDAEALYKQSLDLATGLNYDAGRAHALNCLGGLAQRRGDIDGASETFAKALALADRCGDVALTGMVEQNLGILASIRGDAVAALEHYRR
ncbi:tetratricopeptide repeat protein, partial [Bradyrhizobium sp. NBAIM08]|uniref:tetratricopeptide repeat protein n=1 Tax=Bradyrhizobium sp. NBAIM08 TaxID=2793815 RepID=UPI001CD77ACE